MHTRSYVPLKDLYMVIKAEHDSHIYCSKANGKI